VIKLRFKKGSTAKYETAASAGADIASRGQHIMNPGRIAIIPTGVFIDSWAPKANTFPELQLRLRSSIALNKGLIIPNGVGTIDADYPDEIGLILMNPTDVTQIIDDGERVGQLVLNYVRRIEDLTVGGKRTGGYGSTNK
jgi:dUTP pyrophosphatase